VADPVDAELRWLAVRVAYTGGADPALTLEAEPREAVQVGPSLAVRIVRAAAVVVLAKSLIFPEWVGFAEVDLAEIRAKAEPTRNAVVTVLIALLHAATDRRVLAGADLVARLNSTYFSLWAVKPWAALVPACVELVLLAIRNTDTGMSTVHV
jgi:hypothetical protein